MAHRDVHERLLELDAQHGDAERSSSAAPSSGAPPAKIPRIHKDSQKLSIDMQELMAKNQESMMANMLTVFKQAMESQASMFAGFIAQNQNAAPLAAAPPATTDPSNTNSTNVPRMKEPPEDMMQELKKQKSKHEDALHSLIRSSRRMDTLKDDIKTMAEDSSMRRYPTGTRPCLMSSTDESLEDV